MYIINSDFYNFRLNDKRLKMDILNGLLGKEYDEMFFSSTDIYSQLLNDKGILVFKDFISKNILKKMVFEANSLKSGAYNSSSEYNVYVKPTDLSYDINSARNRIMKTTKKCAPNDLISDQSYLMQIYNSPKIQKFFSSLLGVSDLYPYSDNLSSVNINYYESGDALGWHFDNSDFTITLLIKNCSKGGVYQYFTDMRYKKDGSENYQLVEDILDDKIPPNVQPACEGDLMIFKGNKSLHRVSNILDGERILVTFNYNNQEGVSLSEQSRKTFIGRIT